MFQIPVESMNLMLLNVGMGHKTKWKNWGGEEKRERGLFSMS